MEKMLNAIVREQNEFVMRQESATKSCIVFASENNFVNFPVGYSRYSYQEYEDYVSSHFEVIRTYGQKRIIHCEDRYEQIKEGSYSFTYIINIDGKEYHKRSFSFRAKDNSLFTVVYDVTDLALEEKKKNKKLRKINNQLIKAQNEANIANRAKSDFLSRMSHDMRTPLGAVISLAQFGIEECLDTRYFEYFNQIFENADYLLSLVNDLLYLQTIETNSIELEETVCKYGSTAKAIERIVKLRANEKNIELITSIKNEVNINYVLIDKKRMKQIFVNILNNAIKYTHCGGKVTWSLVIKDDEEGNSIVIHTISDTGVGMSKKFQKHMFEPFAMENNSLSETEGGTGLGLVITKNIIDAMGGSIICKSKLAKGTTFCITLPRKIPTEAQIQEYFKIQKEQNELIDFKSKRILVCEDVKINRIIIKKLLEDKNAQVTLAVNGLEGVELAKTNNFDAILMDIRMPKLNGILATKEIRKFNKNIPIIALSANAFPQDIKQSIDSGMNAHLAKPIIKEELYKILSKLI